MCPASRWKKGKKPRRGGMEGKGSGRTISFTSLRQKRKRKEEEEDTAS